MAPKPKTPAKTIDDYLAAGGPSVCVPFMVTNYGYGLVWDNPSKTRIEPGMSERTRWISEVGNRVSFFVIAGQTSDEIYAGYRRLTGESPLLPKAAYGYIQCKQRYTSQDEVLRVAKGYRERGLPADVMVVDWFYYTKMGQMDFIPEKWPDPAAMNRQLHDLGFETMISVWPRFTKDSRYYDLLLKKGWFTHLADGTPIDQVRAVAEAAIVVRARGAYSSRRKLCKSRYAGITAEPIAAVPASFRRA